ncbi:hypothetical protein VB005_04073 [Metarhizium brunneum]
MTVPIPKVHAFLERLFLHVDEEVNKKPDQELDGRGISKILYASQHFKKYVKQKWRKTTPSEGSFVLMHGGMAAVVANTLFDDDFLNIVGIIDWQWSQVLWGSVLLLCS